MEKTAGGVRYQLHVPLPPVDPKTLKTHTDGVLVDDALRLSLGCHDCVGARWTCGAEKRSGEVENFGGCKSWCLRARSVSVDWMNEV